MAAWSRLSLLVGVTPFSGSTKDGTPLPHARPF
jgi:hypothetical protein